MVGSSSSVTLDVDLAPDRVFDTLIDLAALPGWNAVIAEVLERPAELLPGAEWVVRCRTRGMSWRSRSTLIELDRAGRRFTHRSGTDDGNPSYADWRWSVTPSAAGSRIDVTWTLLPVTLVRRLLMAPMRARMLRREVAASLVALAEVAALADRGEGARG